MRKVVSRLRFLECGFETEGGDKVVWLIMPRREVEEERRKGRGVEVLEEEKERLSAAQPVSG